MNPYLDQHIIANSGLSVQLSERNTIVDVLPLSNDKELISYFSNKEDEF